MNAISGILASVFVSAGLFLGYAFVGYRSKLLCEILLLLVTALTGMMWFKHARGASRKPAFSLGFLVTFSVLHFLTVLYLYPRIVLGRTRVATLQGSQPFHPCGLTRRSSGAGCSGPLSLFC